MSWIFGEINYSYYNFLFTCHLYSPFILSYHLKLNFLSHVYIFDVEIFQKFVWVTTLFVLVSQSSSWKKKKKSQKTMSSLASISCSSIFDPAWNLLKNFDKRMETRRARERETQKVPLLVRWQAIVEIMMFLVAIFPTLLFECRLIQSVKYVIVSTLLF